MGKNPVENIDKVNTVVEFIDKAKAFLKNLFGDTFSSTSQPPPIKTVPDDKAKK
ncbi:MAG TPA: hypothetical protein VL053_17560 [Arachidicoccus sp.]|nr:hypothetical protein [Arachidicoccus sp.]